MLAKAMTASPQLTDALRGKFIVFDGPDGAGKSTQRERLADELNKTGGDVVSCRDPGGTVIGDRIDAGHHRRLCRTASGSAGRDFAQQLEAVE